jgi:hypothetical protein
MTLKPFIDSAVFASLYVALVGLVMRVNSAVPMLQGRDLSWIEYWAIWAIAFIPTAVVTILARLITVPGSSVPSKPHTFALGAIAIAIELCYVADLGPAGVGVVETGVSAFIVGIFRRAERFEGMRPPRASD